MQASSNGSNQGQGYVLEVKGLTTSCHSFYGIILHSFVTMVKIGHGTLNSNIVTIHDMDEGENGSSFGGMKSHLYYQKILASVTILSLYKHMLTQIFPF